MPDETGAGEFAINEVPADVYTDAVKESFAEYNDVATSKDGNGSGEERHDGVQ